MKCVNCDSPAIWSFRRLSLPYCDEHLPAYLRPTVGSDVITIEEAQAREEQLGEPKMPPTKPPRRRKPVGSASA